MIIDNENQKLKVHEWITKYNEEGTICPILYLIFFIFGFLF